jgi:O-antigen ligase
MLVLVAMGSYLVAFGLRRRVWIVAAGLLVVVPLVLTQTRSAQLGALAGLGAILVLKKPRWLPAMCVAVLALYLALPRSAQERIRAGWDPADPNTRNRIELAGTSLRLVRDHPWFGVGPKNVAVEALRYRGTDEFPDWMYQHMHNNFLQIAAERGLPGLLLWIWFMGRLAWDAWILFLRASRKKSPEPREIDREALLASTAAVGAWVALLVAGLFEYNFGDSEILTIFLFMMSTVYSGFVKQPLGRAEPAPIALEQPVVRRTTGGKSHP